MLCNLDKLCFETIKIMCLTEVNYRCFIYQCLNFLILSNNTNQTAVSDKITSQAATVKLIYARFVRPAAT